MERTNNNASPFICIAWSLFEIISKQKLVWSKELHLQGKNFNVSDI